MIDRSLVRTRRSAVTLALVGAATGLPIILRGSLPQGISLALMDIIGFFLVAYYVTAKAPEPVASRARADELVS
jgi:uncharacterized membrane protein YjfL (UPF0719 family)